MAYKNKKQPASSWPKLPFLLIRLFQLLSTIIVLGILIYFIYNLIKDKYPVPWEFLILVVVASFTFLNLLATSVFFCCRSLSPLIVMITDGFLSIFWALGFGLLARAMGKTTYESCTTKHWGNSSGIYVCHMYKALFAFACLGWIAHIASFMLASSVRRRMNAHAYTPANNPVNLQQPTSYTPMHQHNTSYGAPPPPVYGAPDDHKQKPHVNPTYYDN